MIHICTFVVNEILFNNSASMTVCFSTCQFRSFNVSCFICFNNCGIFVLVAFLPSILSARLLSELLVNAPNYVSLLWFSCFLFYFFLPTNERNIKKKTRSLKCFSARLEYEKMLFDCFIFSLILRVDRFTSSLKLCEFDCQTYIVNLK